jgi:hypothetical protein
MPDSTMSPIERAAAFDAADQPLEAIAAYGDAIRSADASLDTYLDLAGLYFTCRDYGYASYHKLPEEVWAHGAREAVNTLDQAEARFGTYPEIVFWRHYIQWIYLDGEPFVEEAAKLAESGETSVPYFYLFSQSRGSRFVEEAQKLLDSVADGKTARDRYVKNNLLSGVNQHRLRLPSVPSDK